MKIQDLPRTINADDLPEHVDPIPMPDTPEEAALLCWLLDRGLYPT